MNNRVSVLVFIIWLIMPLAKIVADRSNIPRSREPTLSECSELMHISFPRKTTLVNSRQIYGMDNSIILKIEIETKDMKSLIEKSPFKGTELSENRRFVNRNPRFDWWHPDSVKTFRSGKVCFKDNSCLCVLFDLDREGRIFVYLEWFI